MSVFIPIMILTVGLPILVFMITFGAFFGIFTAYVYGAFLTTIMALYFVNILKLVAYRSRKHYFLFTTFSVYILMYNFALIKGIDNDKTNYTLQIILFLIGLLTALFLYRKNPDYFISPRTMRNLYKIIILALFIVPIISFIYVGSNWTYI